MPLLLTLAVSVPGRGKREKKMDNFNLANFSRRLLKFGESVGAPSGLRANEFLPLADWIFFGDLLLGLGFFAHLCSLYRPCS